MNEATYYARWTLSNINKRRSSGFAEHKIRTVQAESPASAIDVAHAQWTAEGNAFLWDDTIEIHGDTFCNGSPLWVGFA